MIPRKASLSKSLVLHILLMFCLASYANSAEQPALSPMTNVVAKAGDRVPRQTPEHVALRLKAEQGDAKAQFDYGVCYFYGQEVSQD